MSEVVESFVSPGVIGGMLITEHGSSPHTIGVIPSLSGYSLPQSAVEMYFADSAFTTFYSPIDHSRQEIPPGIHKCDEEFFACYVGLPGTLSLGLILGDFADAFYD